ncbi:15452_t:CDS:1 [Cetraspora pellucida]|uniref:15452_t:CDS:1 n=1 Tax=Cetraspora pellucida TaxID=1433469 RepID=A0A9N9G9C1_9GLOM|nr:15452_t:CDS:1 [Cetraspora pellucida]
MNENKLSNSMDDFCKRMDQWNQGEGEPPRHAFSLGQLLLKENPNSRGVDGATRGIFLIGDQSSSKSTTVNSIIQQVALQIGNNTVTKIRTWIDHRYDPELEKEAKYDLLIEEHDKPEKPVTLLHNRSLQDLTIEFTKLNANNMDDKRDARIIIHSNIPSFAIDCCDNPGLTPTNQDIENITDSITKRTLNKVIERQKLQNDSIVLLCISATKVESPSWTRHMDLIEQLDGKNLIVLVTRMDLLNISEVSQEIRTNKEFIKTLTGNSFDIQENNNDFGPLRCSSWDILQYLRTKIEFQAEPRHFPDGVQFHYAASSSESWDDLLKHGWDAFKESEAKNNEKMHEILCSNKDEWKKNGIELIEMNDKQIEFENSVGMAKLRKKLLDTLHIHIVKAAKELMNYTSEWQSNKIRELDKMVKSIKSFKDRSELITSFCKEFIVVFQTLFASPLYTPTIHSNHRLKKFGNEIKKARETRIEYGWSLHDMWKIFEALRGTSGFAEFPPQEFCDANFQNYIDNIENYINSADVHLNTAQMLIQRLTQEYTLRSSLINLQKPDAKKFVSRQVQASTATQLSFGPAVDQKISEDYGKIFCIHDKYEQENTSGDTENFIEMQGGNQWVSVFGALCLLLHAEYTIRIMRDTEFSFLLRLQNEDPMQGILVSKFKQYWVLRKEIKENSVDQQSTAKQIAKIMESTGKSNFKKTKLTKVSPIDDISWAIYAMFFEKPYRHLKKTLDERTDLLVMTHATSLVHCYQLSGICVHRDEDYLMKWAVDNPNSAYGRAFVVTEQDVIDFVKPSPEENVSNSDETQQVADPPNSKTFHNLTMDNFKTFQKGKKNDKESQTNSAGETKNKPLIFSTLSETMTDRIRNFMKGKSPDRVDMVKLFIDLADMGRNPDTFDEPESKTNLSEKEENAVDYVYRRRLTMGISSSITDVIQQLSKMQYEFSHQQTADILKCELLGRVASLLLGYGYPYHPDERPSSKWYLSPEVVIQFLIKNQSVFESESKSESNWNFLLNPRILESPLVKRIISLSLDDDVSTKNLINGYDLKTVSYHIKRLHMAKAEDLDAYIIEFLADDRFNWQQDEENLEIKIKDLKDTINKYKKWNHYLEAYNKVAVAIFEDKKEDIGDIKPDIDFDEKDDNENDDSDENDGNDDSEYEDSEEDSK